MYDECYDYCCDDEEEKEQGWICHVFVFIFFDRFGNSFLESVLTKNYCKSNYIRPHIKMKTRSNLQTNKVIYIYIYPYTCIYIYIYVYMSQFTSHFQQWSSNWQTCPMFESKALFHNAMMSWRVSNNASGQAHIQHPIAHVGTCAGLHTHLQLKSRTTALTQVWLRRMGVQNKQSWLHSDTLAWQCEVRIFTRKI